jgi:hypothetical protein
MLCYFLGIEMIFSAQSVFVHWIWMTQESTPASWITCASAAFGFVQSTKKFGILVTLSATPVAEREMGPQSIFLGASTQ